MPCQSPSPYFIKMNPQQRLSNARETLIWAFQEGDYETVAKAEKYYRSLSDRFNTTQSEVDDIIGRYKR